MHWRALEPPEVSHVQKQPPEPSVYIVTVPRIRKYHRQQNSYRKAGDRNINIGVFSDQQFSNDCRKTNDKVITPTNHNRSKQSDEPIRIPSSYL